MSKLNESPVRGGPHERIALVVGASRGIGLALARSLMERDEYARVFAASRNPAAAQELSALASQSDKLTTVALDVLDESSVAAAAQAIGKETARIDLLINTTGILHGENGMAPEKRLADVNSRAVEMAFRVNSIGALIVSREFEQLLKRGSNSKFASLSARVGSIGDNHRGGWYAYRASKAALNMFIRTLAIEWSRLSQPISCFALHPGTVATDLSAPFRKNLSAKQVFSAHEAAEKLIATIHALSPEQTGGFFAYDGSEIEW